MNYGPEEKRRNALSRSSRLGTRAPVAHFRFPLIKRWRLTAHELYTGPATYRTLQQVALVRIDLKPVYHGGG